MDTSSGKYLTFLLDEEEYGIPIHDVKEIIGIMDITTIPKTPKFLKGVINLRGKIIPVIDLRLKFGVKEKDYTQRTCIIVVEIPAQGSEKLMGIIVDTVSEVIRIAPEEIEQTTGADSCFNEEYLAGIAKTKGKVAILLDVERILDTRELSLLNK